ncbi:MULTISPECIES: CobW family GTP-binding protein [unclassified Lysinibacillus]|uniref:CobW family GTP-binding protein n=1 Tax=unclassified Lysinibacillus TaxID=2636778 RepID=UPI0038272D2A
MSSGKKPITIITGSLGSGKTTLLQSLLTHHQLTENIAVIVNEFGKIGLDHYLLRQAEEKTTLLQGGCICCHAREDLEEELKNLLFSYEQGEINFDRIIIETTGLADPAPILFTIMTNPILQHRFVIDGLITTVDAKNGAMQIKNHEATVKQISAADTVALTKIDLVKKEELDLIRAEIIKINPACSIVHVENGKVEPSILNVERKFYNNRLPSNYQLLPHSTSHIHSISFAFLQPLNWNSFGVWLSLLLYARGENILRVKGMVDVGDAGPIILNGVQHIIHPPIHLSEWPENTQVSHIVFIMKDIPTDLLKQSLLSFQTFLGTKVDLLHVHSI